MEFILVVVLGVFKTSKRRSFKTGRDNSRGILERGNVDGGGGVCDARRTL